MAFATMSKRLDQISTAVPLGGLIGVRLETPVRIEHHRPNAHCPALIERKGEGVRNRGRVDRREAEEVGFDGERVGVREVGIAGEGHCWVKRRAVTPDTAMERREKVRVGVLADACVPVWRDVGRIDRAEGQDERTTPGERLPTDRRMAGLAIGGADEIAPPVDEARVLEAFGERRRGGQLVVAEHNPIPTCEISRPGAKDDPADEAERGDDNEGGRREQGAPEAPHAALLGASCLRSIGRLRNRTPVAAKSALASAGPATEVPGSPMPPGASPFRTRWTSIAGVSLIRIIR